jgi:hypothetical protein
MISMASNGFMGAYKRDISPTNILNYTDNMGYIFCMYQVFLTARAKE